MVSRIKTAIINKTALAKMIRALVFPATIIGFKGIAHPKIIILSSFTHDHFWVYCPFKLVICIDLYQ